MVRFEIHAPIQHIVHCHCSRCRKAQGSAFATNGIVPAADFKLLSGQANLSCYESSPGHFKHFCKTCGSPIMSTSTIRPGQVRVRLGTIESDIDERPMAHIFVTSRANWEETDCVLPEYEGYEPGRDQL